MLYNTSTPEEQSPVEETSMTSRCGMCSDPIRLQQPVAGKKRAGESLALGLLCECCGMILCPGCYRLIPSHDPELPEERVFAGQ